MDRPGPQAPSARGRHVGRGGIRLRWPPDRQAGRRREHSLGAQPDRLYALLLLSLGGARTAPGLVQVGALSLAGCARPARLAARAGGRRGSRDRGARVGFDRGDPLHGPARAPAGDRRLERGPAGRARHTGRHDRRRPGETPMNGIHDLGGMHGMGPVVIETDEPVFHSEWERRVFALTLAAGYLGKWNLDMSRSAREQMPPAEYLSTSY